MKNITKFIISIVICQFAGILGSFFTAPAILTWYKFLQKPSFSPPNWIFAPVWIILFFLMGISFFLVWKKGFIGKRGKKINDTDMAFALQLILNVLWSVLFFSLNSPAAAFFEIILLWLSILLVIVKFSKISIIASVLMLPYVLWVSFAIILNFFIWRINL